MYSCHCQTLKGEEKDSPPLSLAINQGHLECVRLFLGDPHVEVNQTSSDEGFTPLNLAVQLGFTEGVKLLVEDVRTDVNLGTREEGFTPLFMAVFEGRIDCFDVLLHDTRTNVNQASKDIGCLTTPLFFAAGLGNSLMLQKLLGHPHIDVHQPSTVEKSFPLIVASRAGHIECVKPLLFFNYLDIRLNCQNVSGLTPLIASAMKGHADVVELLLQMNNLSCLVDISDDWRRMVITCLLCNTIVSTKLSMLLWKNIFSYLQPRLNVNQTLCNKTSTFVYPPGTFVYPPGASALWMAAANGHEDCVEHLLKEADVDINQTDASGWSPVQMAQFFGHSKCVLLFEQQKARF